MTRCKKAFSRIDLVVLVATISFLSFLALPLLTAGTSSDSARAVCQNNLRRIGRAAQLWADDHADRVPWVVSITNGGNRTSSSDVASAWNEFSSLSNTLSSPSVFACPADATAKRAGVWGVGTGGFQNSSFRNNALSYSIGLHASPLAAQSIVAADRDLRVDVYPTSCGRGVQNAARIAAGPSVVAWTNALHVQRGNVLTWDGAVQFLNAAQFTNVIFARSAGDGGASYHLLPCR